MAQLRCPVCRTSLSKHKYEQALGILGEREQHMRHEKAHLEARLKAAQAKAKSAHSDGIRAERDRTQRLLAGKDKQIHALHEQLKRLRKGTTPQTDGLEFEDRLFARLKREFPADRLEHDGRGGDILHAVIVKGEPAGLILYECKRCKRVETSHIDQAARDKRARQADFAILVTTGTRRGFTGLSHDGPVLLVSPPGVLAVARLVRAQILEMARARLSKSQREKVAARALDYLTSPTFKGPLEDALARTRRARDLLQREAKAHFQVWNERWALYQTVDVDLTSLVDNSLRVAQGERPAPLGRFKPTPLELPAVT